MASIWTRSGQETYIGRKKRVYSNEESYLSGGGGFLVLLQLFSAAYSPLQ
jgi:hypothetical protein